MEKLQLGSKNTRTINSSIHRRKTLTQSSFASVQINGKTGTEGKSQKLHTG
jgi:hypothetical protein